MRLAPWSAPPKKCKTLHPAHRPQGARLLVWVPEGTHRSRSWPMLGLSPGIMSAGLGEVPAAQTYLDIGQGNRVFDSLYNEPLPEFEGDRRAWWRQVVERAESAPAEIVPGLLTSTLAAAGVAGFETRAASLRQLRGLAGGDELLIAIERPSGDSDAPLAIGIAGAGFDGNLTSDSTRTDGYVLSTDVAPTSSITSASRSRRRCRGSRSAARARSTSPRSHRWGRGWR